MSEHRNYRKLATNTIYTTGLILNKTRKERKETNQKKKEKKIL